MLLVCCRVHKGEAMEPLDVSRYRLDPPPQVPPAERHEHTVHCLLQSQLGHQLLTVDYLQGTGTSLQLGVQHCQ